MPNWHRCARAGYVPVIPPEQREPRRPGQRGRRCCCWWPAAPFEVGPAGGEGGAGHGRPPPPNNSSDLGVRPCRCQGRGPSSRPLCQPPEGRLLEGRPARARGRRGGCGSAPHRKPWPRRPGPAAGSTAPQGRPCRDSAGGAMGGAGGSERPPPCWRRGSCWIRTCREGPADDWRYGGDIAPAGF